MSSYNDLKTLNIIDRKTYGDPGRKTERCYSSACLSPDGVLPSRGLRTDGRGARDG